MENKLGSFNDGNLPDQETENTQIEVLLNYFTFANSNDEFYIGFIEFINDYVDLSQDHLKESERISYEVEINELCWAWETAYKIHELKDRASLSVFLWVVKTNIPEVWENIWNEHVESN